MKKILHITAMDSTKFGSLEYFFINLLKQCNDAGFQNLLQYESTPSSQQYLDELKELKVTLVIFSTQGNAFRMFINLIFCIMRENPEIIHVHFVNRYAKMIIPVIARMRGVRRTICTVHNKPLYEKKNIVRFAYNLYHYVLPVSKSVEESLLVGGVRAEIVKAHYLGLFGDKTRSREYREFFRKKVNIPADGIVLVCIAFDAPFKGLDILLEAFHIIYSRYKNVYLLSVGVDIEQSRLPGRAVQMGVADGIRWAGIVDEGWKLLSAADIYVQPSRAQEGLPLAIMEALAMKLPIVCTNISGNIEAVYDGQNGFVCEPTKKDMAAAIEKMLLQPAVWEEMGEAGYRIFKEQFDGEKSVRKLVEKYYGIMSA